MLTPSPNGARWPEPQPLANPGRFTSPTMAPQLVIDAVCDPVRPCRIPELGRTGVNTAQTGSIRPMKRRNQPQLVSGGRPSSAAVAALGLPGPEEHR